ncbi:hypothetical protein EVAR_98413_1 [Eumeta japonica]|uniref:Uncharacterized protein n=1 Tax=Eumeta variegata TaxID=151549 RepID=A0A4C2AEZ1_EUMVA|nr:hypothetical protein EVAR_98413_1 [Eumeta japonica]
MRGLPRPARVAVGRQWLRENSLRSLPLITVHYGSFYRFSARSISFHCSRAQRRSLRAHASVDIHIKVSRRASACQPSQSIFEVAVSDDASRFSLACYARVDVGRRNLITRMPPRVVAGPVVPAVPIKGFFRSRHLIGRKASLE